MFAVDLLHDFELGVWKSVFKHLIRMLYACGNERVQTLNERWDPMFYYAFTQLILACRYRSISAFGRSTIRKFSNDVSAMKKLAGRDFEDLLQVCNVWLSSISI